MIGLARQVRRNVIVLILFERVIAQVAPKHGVHTKIMRLVKHLRDFLQLALRFLRAEIDRRADAAGSHIESLFDVGEHDLIV